MLALFREHRYAWQVVGLLWVAFFLAYIARQSVFSIFAVLRDELGFTETQLGLTSTVFLWVYASMNLFAGQIGDRFPKHQVVAASVALWALATVWMGAAASPAALLAGRAVLAVTQGVYAPTAVAYISQVHSPATRGSAITAHGTAQYLGVIVGGWYGGYLAEAWSWRWMFWLVALATFAYAAVLYSVLRRNPAAAAATGAASASARVSSVWPILRTPSYLTISLAFIAVNAMLWIVYTWLPDILQKKYSLSAASAGFNATAYVQIAMIAGLVAGAPLGDWLTPRRPRARLWLMAAGLLVSSPCVYAIVAADTLGEMRLAALGYGFFKGVFSGNVWASLLAVVPHDRRAFGVGFTNALGGMVGGVASYLVGYFRGHYAVETMLGAAGVLGWVSMLVLGYAIRRTYLADCARVSQRA